jgi:hypothetical protein
MDLEKLSDEELMKIASGSAQSSEAVDLNSLSNEELEAIAGGSSSSLEQPGFLSTVKNLAKDAGQATLDGVITAGRWVDSYTGAPTRASIGAIQNSENPLAAFARQFGENPDLAPTGKQIAETAGVPETAETTNYLSNAKMGFPKQKVTYSPSAQIGFGIDLAADPLNVIPLSGAAKLAGRGGVKVLEGTKALAKAATPVKVAKGAEAVLDSVKASAKATKSVLDNIFVPKQAEDFQEFAKIAEKNGINVAELPASVEFGPNSVISRGERTIREGPAGQIDTDKFLKIHDSVQEAANNKIQKIGGGIPLNEAEAGTLIRKGYDDAVDRLFQDVDFTYNSVIDQSPGIALTNQSINKINTKLDQLQDFAQKRFDEGITKTDSEQGQQLLRAVQQVRKRLSATDPQSGTFGSMKQVYEAMSDIGRHAFKKGKNALSDVPVDQKKFQDLYFTLREEFVNSTADQLGPEVAQSLIESNELITQFNKNKGAVAGLVGNKDLAPERLFNSLIVNGDTQKIAALKEMLAPEQFQQLKGSLLENLVKRDPDGSISFRNLFNALRNKRTVVESIFDPEEIQDFAEIIKLGDRLGPINMSSSGTGGSNIFSNMLEGVKSGATNRTVIDMMKSRARGAASSVPEYAAESGPILSEKIVPSKVFGGSARSNPEEVMKYLQGIGAQSVANDKDKESAAMRRLDAIRKARGN